MSLIAIHIVAVIVAVIVVVIDDVTITESVTVVLWQHQPRTLIW